MDITTRPQCIIFLKSFNRKLDKAGAEELTKYPAFCLYLDRNPTKFSALPKYEVLDLALRILTMGEDVSVDDTNTVI